MRLCRFLVLAIAVAGGVLLAPSSAFAHDLRATVTVADEVKVVAYFDGDIPAEQAAVIVTDASGSEIAAGKTDERGMWSFPRPAPGEYKLKVESLGHVATVLFSVTETETPVVYAPWRLQKAVGITIGLVLLLGISAISWVIRRQRRG